MEVERGIRMKENVGEEVGKGRRSEEQEEEGCGGGGKKREK